MCRVVDRNLILRMHAIHLVALPQLDRPILAIPYMAPQRLIRKALHVDHHFDHGEELILRDHLSLVRTRLANERTLLSYVRSTMYLLIGGLALTKVEGYGDLRWVGHVAIGIAVFFLLIGMYRYRTLRIQIDRFYTRHMEAQQRANEQATDRRGVSAT